MVKRFVGLLCICLLTGFLFIFLQTKKPSIQIVHSQQIPVHSPIPIPTWKLPSDYQESLDEQHNSVPTPQPQERVLKVPILLYHYVSVNPNPLDVLRTGLSTPPAIFEKQLQLLISQGYTSITLDDLYAAFYGSYQLPPKPIILTFDDGYADFYYYAAPLLRKYKMKGIEFIPTGLIEQKNYMTWHQIEELKNSPYIFFAAHSVHHYMLNKINHEDMIKEIVDSKSILEQHVGYTVRWFAYPYGAYNSDVVEQTMKAGYQGSVTTIPGIWQYKSLLFYLPRFRAGTKLSNDFLRLVE